MTLRLFVLALVTLMPAYALQAAVTIHEVAWMGDTVSANHEWIELYNSGEAAVVLDGWTLVDSGTLSINLLGTIAPRTYAVLERTSEESAPGTAFLIYTGALVNTGTTLTLTDAAGGIMDQVPGGEEWQSIGGDNTTKDTAQYSTSGWVTAPGTPGRTNATTQAVSPPPPRDTTPVQSPPRSSGSGTAAKSAPAVTLSHTPSELVTAVRGPSRVYVNESAEFTMSALGAGPTIVASLVHAWNFGDTYTATGTTVSHRFRYPGTYLLTVQSRFAKHDAAARFEVTVLPVTISIGETGAGDITLNNDAPYEVDVSLYTLRGDRDIVLPPGTVILPRGTITIAGDRLKVPGSSRPVVAYDTALLPVVSQSETVAAHVLSPQIMQDMSSISTPETALSPTRTYTTVAESTPVPEVSRYQAVPADTNEELEGVGEVAPVPHERPIRWPYVVLLVGIAFCVGVILKNPHPTADSTSLAS